MQFSKSVLFYFLATTGVTVGDTSTSTIKDAVGDGGENKMSFSLSYANNDGAACTPCVLCDGSLLHNVFDPKAASLCISCTDNDSCDEATITNTFQKAWIMNYVSLTSSEGDASLDPESISLEASDDYDEGTKTGSWITLATSSSDLIYTTRNEPKDIMVDNNDMYSHYRIIFRRKDNSNVMKVGHVGVVESYFKSYAADLFKEITGHQVSGLPTKSPTAAPTKFEFTNDSLKIAADLWVSNKSQALAEYGDIKFWSTGRVTSMYKLFVNRFTFNEDLSLWDTSSVTSMHQMFYHAELFNADLSKWQTSKVTNMDGTFKYSLAFNGDVSKWDTGKVTQMYHMFANAHVFNKDISTWDVSNVLDFSFMFCWQKLYNNDVSKWNTANATTMKGMFRGAESFNVNLSVWNVETVADMDHMFDGALAFKQNLCWITTGKSKDKIFRDCPGKFCD